MASGRLADYLGKGDAADRPATLDLQASSVGFYYAEDTGELSAWDGEQWLEDIGGGGGLPEAPADGKLYGRKDEAWEEVPGGGGGGGGVTSPTINRIITSTDPDEPLSPGDLLVVLPVPRVIAAAYSPQTYGDGDSVSSVTVTVPLEAREGDLLLLMVGSAFEAAAPTEFSLVAEQEAPHDVSSDGMGRTTVFSMIAGPLSAGSGIAVTQSSSGRMAAVVLVARGEGVEISGIAGESFSATDDFEYPHPIPQITPTGRGQMAVCAMSCALASINSSTKVEWPDGWAPVTPTVAPLNPSHERLRSWVAYRYMQAGETVGGYCVHDIGNHDGSSITVLLECS